MESEPRPMEERVAEHSYLWTSDEWSLSCRYHARTRVYFVFAGARPNARELLAVRQLVPRFTHAPMSQLWEEVGGAAEIFAGEFSTMIARPMIAGARQRGLLVREVDASFKGYLPIRAGGALIIEDDELANRVAAEMLRHGVPVVSHTEVD